MTLKRDALTRLCRARDMLREHAQPRTITEIARQADLSPWHFIRLFEAVFGDTCGNLIQIYQHTAAAA